MFSFLKRYKELVLKLAFADLKVRYRRPFLGFVWALITPLVMVLVFHFVFTLFLKVESREFPFYIYLMTAIFPWRFFQIAVSKANMSICDNKSLVAETNIPRILIPISVVVAELINFLPAMGLMLVILFVSGIVPGFFLLILPLVVLLQIFLIIGISFFVSALQVKYRDTSYIVEIILLCFFYLTPVFYYFDSVVGSFSPLALKVYLINPLVGLISLYRISVLPGFLESINCKVSIPYLVAAPFLWSIFLFVCGKNVFKKCEQKFNDYLST